MDKDERISHVLIDRVAILENFPLLGVPSPNRPGVRKLVFRPCNIFYRARPEKNRVDSLHHWHGAQNEPVLNDRATRVRSGLPSPLHGERD